jgi:DNA-binding CsgD family transcriptional regulator
MTIDRAATGEAMQHRLDLTPRETTVLCLIAGGLTPSQAAARLHISRHTVAQHIATMLRRSQARSRGELIARAYASGILATGTWPPQAEE